MVLVWRITDDSPKSPNFLPAKLSRYTVPSAKSSPCSEVKQIKGIVEHLGSNQQIDACTYPI